MKILGIGMAALLVFTTVAPVTAEWIPSADEMLDHMDAVMGNFSDLEARLSIVHYRDGKPDLQQEVKLYLLQPDKLRLEYLSPEYLAGNMSLAVGNRYWIYIAAADTWYEKDLSELSPSQQPWIMFRSLLKGVRSEYWEYSYEVREDGGLLLLVGLPTEVGAVYGKIELWLDPKNWLPVKRKLYDADGAFLNEARFLQHTEVAPSVWLPLKVEVYDGEGKLVCELSYLEVRVDSGVPESLFASPEGSGGSGN
jgi:outer membrane lipoprotein-sorting protein